MQTLYTMETLEGVAKPGEPQKTLQQHFENTRALLVYLNWFLAEVARYAETEAHKRASKHLPTAEDLNVNTKIAGNEILWRMLEDGELRTQFEKDKPSLRTDRELIRKTYQQLVQTNEYQTYISAPTREKQEERRIMEFILNDLMLANEAFIHHIEENFSNWDDDGDTVVPLIAAYLHKPGSYDFKNLLTPDKADFAKTLLSTVLEKSEHLQELIVPKLKNWDPERIAQLDMVLMKMGVAEFLYFETIPPKVTINEYIDLAKEYSTQQSGQFVNGILDNIHKDLVQQGKMHKVDYRKG